jgi:hypothetical protein
VPVGPRTGECFDESGLAMVNMPHNSDIDAGNCHITQIKSNLLTLYIMNILIHNQSGQPPDWNITAYS